MVKCTYDKCKNIARYNYKHIKLPIYCSTHKLLQMTNVTKRLCEFETCILSAIFDVKNGKGKYCKSHKTADMIDVTHPVCLFEDCTLRPSFGIKDGSATHCATHKTDDMVNVVTNRCRFEGCTVLNPVFGTEIGKGLYCSIHKTTEMFDVKHKICEYDGCKTQAAYGIKGGNVRFCSTHKLYEMVDLKNSYCEYIGCTIVNPVFNVEGEEKGRFCLSHKTPEMIDVKHKVCEHDGCKTRPHFNYKNIKRGRFCAKHKIDKMIDVNHPYCEFNDCIVRPTFGYKEDKKALRCSKHKLDNMTDVVNKICKFEGCITRANFGKPGQIVSRCATHKEKGMIRKPTAKCANCKELAIWGNNLTPVHCESHKVDGEVNLVERNCKSCGLLYILDKDDYCEVCTPKAAAKVYLAKQGALMNYLDLRGLVGESSDKIIDGGACGKERPDRVYDFGDKIVILECDEHQHKDRNCLCEQVRMVNISQSFGGIPTYFIRWNPDTYLPKNKKQKQEPISKRYKLCGDLIENIKENRISLPTALITSIYLYYDGWESLAEEKWQIITSL
jgi:hypothetical protein